LPHTERKIAQNGEAMATIRKRGSRYQAVVRMGGQRPMYGSFRTKTEAKAWATSVEDAINKDEYLPSPEAKRRTVREMLERYRKHELPKKKDQRNTTRYLDYWIDEIGGRKLSTLSRATIIEIRDELVIEKAPATVNRYIATLRHAFNLAVTDWEWAGKNPCNKVKLVEPRGRDRHLDKSEVKALLAACRHGDHPHLYSIVQIALSTGARRGEITGLKWREVDLSTGRAVLLKTKNNERRTLPLVSPVVVELRKLQKVRQIDDDRVFPGLNKGKRTYPRLEDAWQAALTEAEIEDFRFHDLRHTFASRMAMDSKSLQEIAAALGHKTLAMVQRYSHLTDSHVHTAMEETGLKVLGDD